MALQKSNNFCNTSFWVYEEWILYLVVIVTILVGWVAGGGHMWGWGWLQGGGWLGITAPLGSDAKEEQGETVSNTDKG